ncbi:hypothetical protein [Paraburkholderia acidiphila]|uniref:Uncharacterized protein n=1 Tax=Paraburkholderia acidiphila TaxID=2571747 RepID=A0A7Z2J9L3_9BURK|nr:hypothetical protein [Paraburkholderia acidiphila]QGZ56857.1 hypothetical protein FAZ97_18035 [Paraburkholderia acidiphila]
MVPSKKLRHPGLRSAALKVETHHFDIDALRKIQNDAMDRESLTCYVVPANTVLADAAGVAGNIVAVPLNGMDSSELDYEERDINSAVHPRPNGDRIACLMLAAEKIALTNMAPHWAGVSLYDALNVLWIFDDGPVVSHYHISDDVFEQMNKANAIEDDHRSLTPEEQQAWQRVAAEANHIGVFEIVNLTEFEQLGETLCSSI